MSLRRGLGLLLALGGAVACGDLFAPPLQTGALSIAPRLEAVGIQQAEVDRLRVRVFLDSAGTFTEQPKIDSTLALQGDSLVASFSVPILTSPVRALVLLDAIRGSDGAVMFSGQDTVQIRAAGAEPPPPVVIDRFTYTGPAPVSVTIAPKDTVIEDGQGFTFRATALDAGGGNVPVRFYLVRPADSTLLRVHRLTGVVTTSAGAEGEVLVHAITPDSSRADTARVLVGAVPVGVNVTPGYVNVGVGATTPLAGAVVDALGNPIAAFAVTYTARNAAVATVSASGVVTGVSAGTAVIYVAATDFPGDAAFTDSALVRVVTAGQVIASATAEDGAFAAVDVGSDVVVEVAVDMRFVAGELLGSYNAVLTWDPAVLAFGAVEAGDFPMPETNTTNTAAGELRFAQANPTGQSGAVVVARVRFTGVAAGQAGLSLGITELSAAQTFTDLIGLVSVTNGIVTVR